MGVMKRDAAEILKDKMRLALGSWRHPAPANDAKPVSDSATGLGNYSLHRQPSRSGQRTGAFRSPLTLRAIRQSHASEFFSTLVRINSF